MQFWSLSRKDPLEEKMATHFSILSWKIPWTEEPGGYSPWSPKRQTWLSTQHIYFLFLFLLPLETHLRKYCYDLCQRMANLTLSMSQLFWLSILLSLLLVSCSVMSGSLWPSWKSARLFCPWHFPEKNIGVEFCFLAQMFVRGFFCVCVCVCVCLCVCVCVCNV